MKKILFVTDLDETLLDSERKVTLKSAEMIDEAIREYGAYFSVATARTPGTVLDIMKDIDTDMPYIVMTGGALWYMKSDMFDSVKSLSEDKAREIVDVFGNVGVPALLYCLEFDGQIHLYRLSNGKVYSSEYERSFVESKRKRSGKAIHIDENGLTPDFPKSFENPMFFFSMQTPQEIDKVVPLLEKVSDIDVLTYRDSAYLGMVILEVRKKGVSKAASIRELRKRYGFDYVVAYGDNYNDISMLREADLAVAVFNAIGEVKEIADVVLEPGSDAVARHILDMSKNNVLWK